MKGLKCTTCNCEFNNCGQCTAGIINIGSNAVCKTKIKTHGECIEDEYKRMEVGESLDFDETDDVLVQCDSIKCKYNKDHLCTANHVLIEDTLAHTKCTTRDIR